MWGRNKNKACELSSPIYRDILASNNNGKKLANGSIRIGNEYILNHKTHIIEHYKL